eukprot:6208476-Pleurochrysis_carterae.AAC.2
MTGFGPDPGAKRRYWFAGGIVMACAGFQKSSRLRRVQKYSTQATAVEDIPPPGFASASVCAQRMTVVRTRPSVPAPREQLQSIGVAARSG